MTTFPTMKIEARSRTSARGKPEKGRRFEVSLLTFTVGDWLWQPTGKSGTARPLYVSYAGSDQACKAFTANFRAGRSAAAGRNVLKIPKKSPHRWIHQRFGGVTVTTAYVPELFHLEPTVTPQHIRFVSMPPTAWVTAQAERLQPDFGEDATDAARAALFVAFLDRRTSLPLVNDLRFHLQLYRTAIEQELVRDAESMITHFMLRPRHFCITDEHTACGLERPLAIDLAHDTFETFLNAQTQLYFEEEIRHGTHRIPTDRRILPVPAITGPQLCFDFTAA